MKVLRSLSFRLTLAYMAMLLGSMTALAGIAYWFSISRPLGAVKDDVSAEAGRYRAMYASAGTERLARSLDARAARIAPRRAFHALIAPGGRVVTANLPSWPRSPAPGWFHVEADVYMDGDEADHESLTLDHAFPDGTRLLIGRDIEDIDTVQEQLAAALIWVASLSVLLGITGGMLMSLAIGRRIDGMARTAQRVIAGDLSERVPLRGSGDDFDRLGETLNLMLARIEELVESVRRVSDNVAHELRTPLARLRADLEGLGEADPAGRDNLEAAIAEAGRLEAVFDAVLRIARLESRRHAESAERIDLAPLLADAVEFYAPAAEDKGLMVETAIEPGLAIAADRNLMFQAICNVLDNAVKYATPGGSISVSAFRHGGDAVVRIADDGPGVAAEERVRLTERFYRVEETSHVAGAGLGLSFVAAVVRRHGGEIGFEDAAPGLAVTLRFAAAR